MTTVETKNETEQVETKEKKCGIIMPIAHMNGYTKEHWVDVKNIIQEATREVKNYTFKTEIVSNSDGEIDIIHKRIIQNIYFSEIVICDISGKNPNVMFELGMRLAFDKPTIIIKDDATDFIFDTGSIEHLIYPKDLRFQKIVEFKKELAKRIEITYKKSIDDPGYSTFLGNFGEFKVPTLNQTTITSVEQLILDQITSLSREIKGVKKEVTQTHFVGTDALNYNDYFDDLMDATLAYMKFFRDDREPEEIVNDTRYINYINSESPHAAVATIGETLYAIKIAQNRTQVRIK